MRVPKIFKKKDAAKEKVPSIYDDYDLLVDTVNKTGDPFEFLKKLKNARGSKFDIEFLAKEKPGIEFEIAKEANVASMVRDIIEQSNGTFKPKDTRVDDSAMPLAKNFYEWVTRDEFAGTVMTPFLEQLIWGIILFAEFCVARDSYIHTSKGLVRVQDLVGNPTATGMDPLKVKVATDSGIRKTSHGGMTSKRRKCLKITYSNGHSITVTPEHKVQILESDLSQAWVKAQDLTVSDFGIMPYGTNLWPKSPAKLRNDFEFSTSLKRTYRTGTEAIQNLNHTKVFSLPKIVTKELARLTGYLISDGRIHKNTISFINTDKNLVKDFNYCCYKVFGHKAIIKKGSKPNSTMYYYTAQLHGRDIVRYLKSIGFAGTLSYDKVIPDYILQSDKQTVIECLRAIFDCDGFIDFGRVGVVLASVECVKQISLLMQNLGIYGTFRDYYQDTSRNKYVKTERESTDFRNHRGSWVTKNSTSIELYSKIIGTKHQGKKVYLDNRFAKDKERFVVPHTKNVRPGCIPFAKDLYRYAKTLKTSYHDKGLKFSKFARSTYFSINSMLEDDSFVSFFGKKDPSILVRLKELQTSNYAFSQIISIEDAGYHDVYDLTVPSVENFLCNGVVVHNCPRCSDVDWLYDDHKVDDTFLTFERKVCLFENGVCPACKGRRSEFVNRGELFFYQELAVCAGQRCVTGDTCILTEHGLMSIGEYAKNKRFGFSRFHLNVHNGTELEQTTDFYRAKPEFIRSVTLYNGIRIRGTSDHPIQILDGVFKRIADVSPSDIVPTRLNQQVFGNRHLYFEDIMMRVNRKSRDYTAKKYPTLFKSYSGDICSDMYKVLGLWVAEGRRAGISNKCLEVNAFYLKTLMKYINKHHIRVSCDENGNTYTSIRGHKGRLFFAELLGLSSEGLSSGSALKEIPLSVRTSTKENVCAFLQGLYEGDGWVSRNIKKDQRHSVSYCTISQKLAYQLSAMLHNLGIAHRIRRRWTWATNGTAKQISKPSWFISIRGVYLKRFRDQIGFLSSRKKNQLDHAIDVLDSRTNLVPYWYENLEFLESRLVSLLDRWNAELHVFPLPYYERVTSEKFRTRISKITMGIGTVFGRSSEKLSFPLRKLRKSKAVRLTKRKLLEICTVALQKVEYMSPEVKFEFEQLLTYCSDDVVFCRVVKNQVSTKRFETYDFTLPKTHQFVTGGIISHNSGKSATVGGMLSPYMAHRVLKMQKPAEVYGITSSTMLHGTFCALTYAQAKETLWEFFYGTLVESPWFREYHNMLSYYGDKYGQQLYKFNDTFVAYRCRNLMWYPAGPDKRILRGRTRIFGGVDEIGYFDNDAESKKIKMSAAGVYDALDSSLLTVRGAAERLMLAGYDDVMNGMGMNVSSPAHRRDKIMSLVSSAQTSNVVYGIHRPTWEVNPTLPRTSKVIMERYRTDPAGAERDFGAMPPLAASPFISDLQSLAQSIGTHPNPIKMSFKLRKESGLKSACRWGKIDKIKKSSRPSILGIDAGHTNNSFACCVARKDLETGIATVDLLVEIMPKPGFPLNYTMIYEEILVPIFKNRNIKVFLADRWNSLKILSDAEAEFGILTKQYSLKYKDLWLPKTMVEQLTLRLPRFVDKNNTIEKIVGFETEAYPSCFQGKEVEHLVVQMLTVQDTGTKVIKGDGLTDDLWRALTIALWGLYNEDFQELLQRDPGDAEKFRPAALGFSRLGSGGSGSSAAASGSLSCGGVLGKIKNRS